MLKRWYLKKLRDERKLSIQQLADEINTSASVIWQLENLPDHNPELKTLARVADFFGIDCRDLVVNKEEMLKYL